MIEITGVDMAKFIKKAYDLSKPLGMGYFQYTPEPLTDEEAQSLINKKDPKIKCSLDYVKGRACKMTVHKEVEGSLLNKKERLFIRAPWFDHTDSQLKELLEHCGFHINLETKEHAPACTCGICEKK